MNAPGLALPAPLAGARERLVGWWRALTPRDRRIGKLGALVIGVALVWLAAVQPALRTLREAPPVIERLDVELQQMQALAAESRGLRAAPPVAPAAATAALQAAAARLGERARVVVQGERATLTVNAVDGVALRALLAEIRSTARARPIEAQLNRGPTGFNGTLVLSLGGGA